MPHQDNLTSLAIFDGHNIRQVWHDDEWYFSVVDVVAALTESVEPRKYWFATKSRFRGNDFTLAVSKCIQLKLIASDNKYYLTDCSTLTNLVSIMRAIPALMRQNRSEENTNISCIYAIINTITGERYIGSSTNLNDRFSQHRSLLRRGKHHAIKLQEAWNVYGEMAFRLEILEEVEDESYLESIEQSYITRENPTYNSRNSRAIANNSVVFPRIEDVKIHRLLETLRANIGIISANEALRDIQLAIDFGIIMQGPNFPLLTVAEINGATT